MVKKKHKVKMGFIIYIYYRLKRINPNYGNLIISIQFSAIILLHLMPLISVLDEFFDMKISGIFWNLVKDDDVITRRLIKLPILFSPLFLGVYFFVHKNNNRIIEGCKKLELLPKKDLRKKNFYMWIYIILSIIFLNLGITSSGWVPKLK